MASVVSIKIVLDNAQALPEIDKINEGLASIGVKGTASFNKAGAAATRMGGHVSTGLDSVRLLSQEFGFRLPRAIEAMLARIPAVTNALGSLLGVMAGIAAAQVFLHVAEEVYKAWNEYVSLNAQADKFYETLKKTAQEDVVNTRSIETTHRRLDQATSTATNSARAAQTFHSGGFSELLQGNMAGGIADLVGAHGMSTDAVTGQSDMIKLGKVQLDQTHQQALAQIELNHGKDAELVGQQKINAELAKKTQIAAEDRSFDRKQEMYYGNPSPGNAGAAEEQMKVQTAQAEAQAQTDVAGREGALAIMKAQDAAAQARLSGEDLYFRKAQDDQRELARELANNGKAAEIPARVQEINEKYFADMSERFVKMQNEGALAIQKANASALTGAARINAEHDISVGEANTKDPEIAAQLREAAANEQNQKLLELQQQFSERMGTIEESRTDATLNGYARIDAAAQKEIDRVNEDFTKSFGGGDPSSASTVAAEKEKQTAITTIQNDANTQRLELTTRNNDETLRYDQQAAEAQKRVRENGVNGWVASYKDGMAEIQAKDAEQTAKLKQELDTRQIDQATYDRRKVDVDSEANAEISEQNQQMQQKIAGDLQAAFTHPVDFIKQQMEKMFFDIVAGWIVHLNAFQSLFGQSMGSLQPGQPTGATGHGGFASTIAQAIPGARGIVNGHPNTSSIYESAGSSSTTNAGGGYNGGSGTASSAAAIASGGGSSHGGGGFGVGAALGDLNSVSGTLSAVTNAGGFGGASPANTSSLTGAQASQADNTSFGDNGEDGGFAGSLTGDSDSMTMARQAGANGTDDSVGTAASQQVQGSNAAAAGAGGNSLAKGLGLLGVVGTAGYSAEQSTVKAFDTADPLSGAIGDASAGAQIGSLFGPEGTLIGAGVGAAVGASAGLLGMAMGEGTNLGARSYYEKSVLPTLEGDMTNPGGDYQSAVSDVGKTASDAMAYMSTHFGAPAARWVNANYMQKETAAVLTRIEDTAKAGRQYTTRSAAQFHTGGTIHDFGSFGTSSNEGFIHAMLGETVMNTQASNTHGAALNAMQGGATTSDIASMYLAGSKPTSSGGQSGGDTHHHWDVNTMDAKSFERFLKDGAARQITKHVNTYASQYAGDGISG